MASPDHGRAKRTYPVVVASGSYHDMGEQIGRAAGGSIRALCAMYAEDDAKPEAAPVSVDASLAQARLECPHLLEEIEGMALGAGVSVQSLFRLNGGGAVMPWQGAEPEPVSETGGCTSLAMVVESQSAEQSGVRALLGQNWDNEPRVDPYTIVTIRHPSAHGVPSTICVGRAGLIGYIGFSSSGFGILLNALKGQGATGLPLYFNVRKVLESSSLEQAVTTLRTSERDRPNNCTIVSPQGPAHLEITCGAVGVIRPTATGDSSDEDDLNCFRGGRLVHTNHYLAKDLAHLNSQYPEIIQSVPRLGRATRLADELQLANRHCHSSSSSDGHLDVDDLQALLRDHEAHPRSICRHPNSDEDTGEWITVRSASTHSK
jgi:isopenicillin-N N-acyltransferase-like protein